MSTNLARLFDTPLQDALADKLARIYPMDGGSFEDVIWRFLADGGRKACTLDFSIFTQPHLKFQKGVLIRYSSHEVALSSQDFAKAIWLNAVANKSPTGMLYYGVFNMLAGLFAFLVEKKTDCLDADGLEEFYGFLLTQDVTEKGVRRRLSAPSYENRLGVISLPTISRLLSRYATEGMLANISDRQSSKALNNACQSLMNITLAQYKEGGSFNFLGLDVGKHYIDHCHNVFEEHYAYSAAIRKTLIQCLNSSDLNDNVKLSKKCLTWVLGSVLKGMTSKDILIKCRVKLSKIEAVRNYAHTVFCDIYVNSSRLINAFKIDTINRIVGDCALPVRYDTQEFVRSLLFVDMFAGYGKSKEAIWQEYAATCDDNEKLPLGLAAFEQITKDILDQTATMLPTDAESLRAYLQQYLKTLPISVDEHHFSGVGFLNMFTSKLAHAGLTCWVGLTGWRASEYGFPMSAIGITINSEPSDNHYTPWRFNVKWKVPKTSGDTLLEREITLSSYILAAQLAHLNASGNDLPALYSIDYNLKEVGKSEIPVKTAVSAWWGCFVANYCLFKDIDRWELLSEKGKQASDKEHTERLELETLYKFTSSIMVDLARMRNRLRDNLPVVALALETSSRSKFGIRLRKYLAGELDSETALVLESNISKETMDKLKSGDYELTKVGVQYIRTEMLSDAVYPTPHALRHVWAEAVLRRYRGDVGKFIRANFKHLDGRFFMAYLRNKEMQAISQVATRSVISSVVRQQLESVNDEHRDYAGGFDRYLSKVVNITHIRSQDEYEKLTSKISDQRVVSMKSNPWADCFLRAGSENIAKCSKNGVPQRQNAEPKLCLGCVNGNIAEGNFIGIVVYTKQDVEACRNPRLPYFIKEQHIEVVNMALKRVRELRDNSADSNKYDEFIEYLVETLEIVQQESKVA
tara:strand:+ start:1888 stop:4644 length:2757 start_codon:yes stop_codon:yes gene_type:complete